MTCRMQRSVAKIPTILQIHTMNSAIWLPAFSVVILILTGCTDTKKPIADNGNPLGTGPFDSRGNYIEEWANDPSKWRKPSNRNVNDDIPVIAKNDQPPADSIPLSSNSRSTSKPTVSSKPTNSTKPSAVVSSKPTTSSKPDSSMPKPTTVKTSVAQSKPKPKSTRCVVKKGDTLSGIASRYGTSVTAIRRANDLSGSTIRPGQSLVIPKR